MDIAIVDDKKLFVIFCATNVQKILLFRKNLKIVYDEYGG